MSGAFWYIDTVAAVREILGSDRSLMIDANQRGDLERATSAMEALAAFDPAWIEEPLRARVPIEDAMIEIRRELRTAKQYQLADQVRTRLSDLGVTLEDSPSGTTWRIG